MIQLHAIQISQQINLKKLRAEFDAKTVYATSSELFYKIDTHKYIHIFNYGVIVFTGHSDHEKKIFKDTFTGYFEDSIHRDLFDTFLVGSDESITQPTINNNAIVLPKLEDTSIRLVSLNLAQSVSLDYYENLADTLLNDSKTYVDQLEKHGKVYISKVNLLKFIGRTRNIKNSIVDNLYILDDPNVVWDDYYLDRINKGLKELFDIYPRFRDLDYKLGIVEGNLDLFTNILQHHESSRLEWIIIILILAEIINSVLLADWVGHLFFP